MQTHKEKVKLQATIDKGHWKQVVVAIYDLILRLDGRLKSVERQIGRRT